MCTEHCGVHLLPGSALFRSREWLRPHSRARSMACAQFKVYLMIECGVWLPACYVFCYRFKPTIRFMASPAGRSIVERSGALLERWAPSWHTSIVKLAGKIEGAPASRAAGEWALINKVLAPIGFPTKMWIAHKVVEARHATAAIEAVPVDVAGGRARPLNESAK